MLSLSQVLILIAHQPTKSQKRLCLARHLPLYPCGFIFLFIFYSSTICQPAHDPTFNKSRIAPPCLVVNDSNFSLHDPIGLGHQISYFSEKTFSLQNIFHKNIYSANKQSLFLFSHVCIFQVRTVDTRIYMKSFPYVLVLCDFTYSKIVLDRRY